jgi:amino acid permease
MTKDALSLDARADSTIMTDVLVPDYDSPQRKSPLVVATFNLSATIVAGGVLSLPLAFAKCGIVVGTVLMIVAGIVTDRSLYLLCLCARQTGATSYGEVGKVAFGKYMECESFAIAQPEVHNIHCLSFFTDIVVFSSSTGYLDFISGLLFVFLLFVLTGFMVLNQDIWTDIVEIIGKIDKANENIVLLVIIAIMSPFLVQRTLHALRFNCYVGFGSISILCLALGRRALTTPLPKPLLLWTTSMSDALFAFPIITLSFLSIFNILPIQGALIDPSRPRMKGIITGAVGSSFILMWLFSIFGYLYAGVNTNGNILLNCDHHADWMFFLGRLGCGLTIMLGMANVLLPCRASFLEVVDMLTNHPHIVVTEEELPLIVVTEEELPLIKAKEAVMKRPSLAENPAVHYTSTLGIVVVCYSAAVRAPGVAFVWSLCGSFMAFLIAFILPAACYIKLQRRNPTPDSVVWIRFSWVLLVASVIATIACSIQTLSQLF